MKEKKSNFKFVKTKNPNLINKQRLAIISYYKKKREQVKRIDKSKINKD